MGKVSNELGHHYCAGKLFSKLIIAAVQRLKSADFSERESEAPFKLDGRKWAVSHQFTSIITEKFSLF